MRYALNTPNQARPQQAGSDSLLLSGAANGYKTTYI
jgi:hypothetical protein